MNFDGPWMRIVDPAPVLLEKECAQGKFLDIIMNKIGTKFVVVGSTYEIVSESSFNGVPHWGFQLRQPSWG